MRFAWLGHADPSFTLRTYVHLMDAGVGDADFLDTDVYAAEPESARQWIGRYMAKEGKALVETARNRIRRIGVYRGPPTVAAAIFTDVIDWLADHAGRSVYVEVGTADPDAPTPGDAIVVAMHPTLGEVEDATDTDRGRRTVMVRLVGGERDRIYLDPARVTRVEGGPGGLLRVWIHDAFYIAFSGSR